MKQERPEKGDMVFINPFGAVGVESVKTKKHLTLLVDGEDVYGWFVNGKVRPIREDSARFALKVEIVKDASGQEQAAQEGIILDIWRPL